MKVDDSVEAEKMMLELMNQCVSLKWRNDLGNEWFQTVGEFSFEQRAEHLRTIAKIVQRASNIPSNKKRIETLETSQLHCENSIAACAEERPVPKAAAIKGLDEYFKTFDAFVAQEARANHSSALDLMRLFETSSFCTMMSEYLPISKNERLKIVETRYENFLT
jgi:hypothetical protein